MKDPFVHENEELAAVLAFQVVPVVARAFVFMRITYFAVAECCAALSAHLGSIEDLVLAFASSFVCSASTGVSEDSPAFTAGFCVFLRNGMLMRCCPPVAMLSDEVATALFGQLVREHVACSTIMSFYPFPGYLPGKQTRFRDLLACADQFSVVASVTVWLRLRIESRSGARQGFVDPLVPRC